MVSDPMPRQPGQLRFAARVRTGESTPRLERGPAALAVAIYAAVALLAVLAAGARGRSPVETTPWLPFDAFGAPGTVLAHVISIALGLALAFATVQATRTFVTRYGWAKVLHADLRPAIRHASGAMLVVLGVASAASEELLFRGLLATVVGIVPSAVAFGLVHQVRGAGRWAWIVWATVMGLLFGVVFSLTGSLLGPIVAHAVVNVQNLRFLRDTDVEPPPARRMGGLLRRA
jgi:uncharacterized protein